MKWFFVPGSILAAAVASAQFYTVETGDNLLVQVNLDGTSSVIGGLDIDAFDVEIAWSGSTLYMLNSNFGTSVNLYTIDTNTGLATFVSNVTRPDSSSALIGESFAAFGGNLYAGLSSANNGLANIITQLDPGTGTTTLTSSTGLDLDAMAFVGSNLYGLDVLSTGSYAIYSGSPSGLTALGSDSGAGIGNINSLGALGSDLYGLSAQGTLHHMSTVNGTVLSSVVVSSDSRRYGGLAAVPEPASMLGVGAIAALLARKRKKQN